MQLAILNVFGMPLSFEEQPVAVASLGCTSRLGGVSGQKSEGETRAYLCRDIEST